MREREKKIRDENAKGGQIKHDCRNIADSYCMKMRESKRRPYNTAPRKSLKNPSG